MPGALVGRFGMPRSTLHRFHRWFVSLALLAVLANALAPAVSQARQAGRADGRGGSEWVEICSATGSKWLRLDAAGRILEEATSRPADAPAATHGAACGYCLPHAGSFALPVADPTLCWGDAAAGSDWSSVPTLGERRPTPVWSWPALRGPPQA